MADYNKNTNNQTEYNENIKDFELVNEDARIMDKKFETKPTTFLKDAFRRFCKNKSSVAGAIIIGLLVSITILVMLFSPYDVKRVSKTEQFLAPKIFNAGFGIWDGTRKYERVIYDVNQESPAGYYKPAVIECTIDENPSLIEQANKYGTGGFITFANESKINDSQTYLQTTKTLFTSNGNYKVKISLDNEEKMFDSYLLAEYRVIISYQDGEEIKEVVLKDWSKDYSTYTIDISNALEDASLTEVTGALRFETKGINNIYSYILIKSCEFTCNETQPNYEDITKVISFTDATQMVLIPKDSIGYWQCTGRKGIHKSEVYYCDFVFDTYAEAYDGQEIIVAVSDLKEYIKKGWCEYDFEEGPESFKKLNYQCPIDRVISETYREGTTKLLNIKGVGNRYVELGYKQMPKFIFGTNVDGQDVFTKAFRGLFTSLILGVCTATVCLAFGLVWGAISGYFGGTVDIAMERFCEILSGIPWIVIMTLCILKLGSNFGVFLLALCMTGWLGTAGRTRTQFYRFKGREYVLASRTLGASDMRLIFKHILPNALGTIVTGSVFMVTSVIFSEATLAYLHLGLEGLDSFGILLAENQQYLSTYPNLVIFPAIIIALIMISLNLFGNGLRDAINPSLKGTD